MAGSYILAFQRADWPEPSWLPCFLTEDLTKREMQTLQQAMQRAYGYVEGVTDQTGDDWYNFEVVAPIEDPTRFVGLKKQWYDYLECEEQADWGRDIANLSESAASYGTHIQSIRSQLPIGAFLTADCGSGEGEVFDYVENLTEQELEILEVVLHRELEECGFIFTLVRVDDVTEDNPAYYIRLQRDWRWFQEEKLRSDSDDPLNVCHRLAWSVIEDILEWRETMVGREESEPGAEEGVEHVATDEGQLSESCHSLRQVPSDPLDARLTVSLDPPQATLDGTCYAIEQDQAILIKSLLEADGDWVSGKSMDMRAERVKVKLPEPVLLLIESIPGKGHRIPRNRLVQLRQDEGTATPE